LKEEQNIKLKSEIVIYRAKLESMKQKLQDGIAKAEGDRVGEVRQQMADEVTIKEIEIAQLKESVDRQDGAIAILEN
jgi:hypothetical protein